VGVLVGARFVAAGMTCNSHTHRARRNCQCLRVWTQRLAWVQTTIG